MRAVAINQYGGPDVLELTDLPMPQVAGGQVLIAVRAAAVNPADGKWRAGMFEQIAPVPMPHVLGYDVAGTIEAGSGFAEGTRVVAMLNTFTKGGYAEFAAVNASDVATIPDDMSFETAAALPTASLTGVQLVDKAVNAQAGNRILITGALGAVGSVAVWAALERGAHVIAGVREGRADDAKTIGASETAIIGKDWPGEPFDHIIDTVGGPGVAVLAKHLKPGGKFITAATDPIPSDGLPVQPEFFGVSPSGDDLARIVGAVSTGKLAIAIAKTLPLSAAAKAQAIVDAGGTGGKVILTP